MFQFVRKSIMGGLSDSINPYVKLDNENQTIAYNDISSQYPHELRKNYLFQIINLLKNLMKTNMDKIKIIIVLCYVM